MCSKDELDLFRNLVLSKLESFDKDLKNVNPDYIETQLREIHAKLVPVEEQLRNKLDCDIYDEEIDKFK